MAPLLLALALFLSGQPDRLTTVEGRVLDSSTNQPIPNARVTLLRLKSGAAATPGSFELGYGDRSEALTGVDGGFRFHIEQLNRFYVFADAEGYVRGGPLGPANLYESKGGAAVSGIVLRLHRTVGVSGRVLDRDTGQPVPGVAVEAYARRSTGPGSILGFAGKPAQTDKNGQFRLERLAPGDYYVEVRPPLGAAIGAPKPVEDFRHWVNRTYSQCWYPGVDRIEDALPIRVLEGAPLEGIEIKIAKTIVASIRGRILAEDGTGTEEISVALISAERRPRAGAMFKLVAQGKIRLGSEFQVDNAFPGTYWLTANRPSSSKAPDRKGGAILQIGTENQEGIEVMLHEGLHVTGVVRLEGREPREGEPALPSGDFKVTLTPLIRPDRRPESTPVQAKDGTFAIAEVAPDTYRVGIDRPPQGYQVSQVRYNRTACPHGIVQFTPGADDHRLQVTLALADASLVATAMAGSDPAPGATVLLIPEPFTEEALYFALQDKKADDNGRATFTELLPGAYRVAAYAEGALWADDPNLKQRLASGQEIRLSHKQTATAQAPAHSVP